MGAGHPGVVVLRALVNNVNGNSPRRIARGGEGPTKRCAYYRAVVGGVRDAVGYPGWRRLRRLTEIASLAELATFGSDAAQSAGRRPRCRKYGATGKTACVLGRAAERRRWLNGGRARSRPVRGAGGREAAPPTTQADERPAPASRAPGRGPHHPRPARRRPVPGIGPPPVAGLSGGSTGCGKQGDWARCPRPVGPIRDPGCPSCTNGGWCAYQSRPSARGDNRLRSFHQSVGQLRAASWTRQYGLLLFGCCPEHDRAGPRDWQAAAPLDPGFANGFAVSRGKDYSTREGVAGPTSAVDYARAVALFSGPPHALTGARRRDLALLERVFSAQPR